MANANKRYPAFRAFVVSERKGCDKGNWREVGAAWTHADGNGLAVKVDAVSLNGELVLRIPVVKGSEDHADQPGANS